MKRRKTKTIWCAVLLATLLAWGAGCLACRADWPTYMADSARSGVTAEGLKPGALREVWAYRPKHAPRPAWGEEAKADLYNRVFELRQRQRFDYVSDVVVVSNRVCFGSSSDDKVMCLDAGTGKELWSVFAEGPVRLCPTIDGGFVYFGSDDGCLCCVRLEDGHLQWRTRLGPRDYRIPGNGRVISAWPVRSGIVVRDRMVYCSAGMFPSEGVYICAVDAEKGQVRWKTEQKDLPAQGYMLASDTRLYVPAGRNNPVVLDRATGKRVRVVDGSGGTYALLAGDTLVFGPGKTGQLGLVPAESSDQLATFQGNHMIVTADRSYLQSDQELSALDRPRYLDLAGKRRLAMVEQGKLTKQMDKSSTTAEQKQELKTRLAEVGRELDRLTREMGACTLWKRPCGHPRAMVLAGTILVAGGDNQVAGYEVGAGAPVWQAATDGSVGGLAVAGGAVYASTERGTIHCLRTDAP